MLFCRGSVEYLGHIITKEGVATDPRKCFAINDWPRPKNIKQLRGFLGLARYEWNDQAQIAFDQLKQSLSTPLVLALPDFSQEFLVETDASGEGIREVLMQRAKLIDYLRKAMAAKHKGLSVYDNVLMSIIFTVTKWQHYLLGRHFVIQTDHRSLQHMLTQKVHSSGQLKWLTKLLAFYYEIRHKKGKDNVAADALSRMTGIEVMSITLSHINPTLLQEVMNSWSTDPKIKHIIDQGKSGDTTIGKYS